MDKKAAAQPGLPGFLTDMLARQYEPDVVESIIEGSQGGRATALRANLLKAAPDSVAAALEAAGLPYRQPSWSDCAFCLEPGREDAVRALGAYAQGEVYLQSLSSQLPAIVLGPRAGADVLDMCAAPGGKTCQMAALSEGRARITACEMHMPRAERLEHNLRVQGARGVSVMRVDARRLDDFFSFDQILLDAPCSGSGTVDVHDPKMPQRLTAKLVEKSVKSQAALLKKALALLKVGGTLVYSTCSILACENEDVVAASLSQARGSYRLERVDLPGAQELPLLPTRLDGALCVRPTTEYEGFFVAKLRRLA